MKYVRWIGRARGAVMSASRDLITSKRRDGKRRIAAFETLESRLAFSGVVSLQPTSSPDVITVGPGSQAGKFEVELGPMQPAVRAAEWYATFAGDALYQTAGANITLEADRFFAVDLSKHYVLGGWAKSGDEFGQRFRPDNLQSFGFASYDSDLKPILPQHVLKFGGATDTTLAAPLNVGDTVIHLTNAAGWSNSASNLASTRGLAWYGYQNSDGTTYTDYTYTRNVALGGANGLWAAGGVVGNTITLSSPWTGPALAAGTAVRNTGAGAEHNYVALDSESVPDDWTWTRYATVFGGQVVQGGNDAINSFKPGTAFIRPVISANEHGTTENYIRWGDVSLSEVAAGTQGSPALPVIDLTNVTGGDQRYDLTPGTYHWGESLVAVDTSERYSLSGRAANLADTEDRPLAFASFDTDKKLIHALHVTKYAHATDTTLAAALSPGDTAFYITNASGWSNDQFESAETRALAWYGYTDSLGHTYADYTYTRNVAFDLNDGLWRAGGIRYEQSVGAYRVELLQPWSGPAIAAGMAVRNAASGNTLNQLEVAPGLATRNQFDEYAATFGGSVWQNGARREDAFRPGTAYIQPLFTRTSTVNYITVAPAQNVTETDEASPTADRRFTIDVDVLAKPVFNVGPSPLSGDFDRNGVVNILDYVNWRQHLGTNGLPPSSGADGNGNGRIDEDDYRYFSTNYSRTTGAVVIDSVEAHFGTATIVAGPAGRSVLRYQSDPWFVGSDVVTYTLRDVGSGEVFTSTVTFNVPGSNWEQNAELSELLETQGQVIVGNAAPKAVDDYSNYTILAGQTLFADGGRAPRLLSNDTGGADTLVVRLLDGPSHGSLQLNYDGTFEYTPAAGFVGTDSFRYEAFDGLHSDVAFAMIKVSDSAETVLMERMRNVSLATLNYESSKRQFPLVGTAAHFDANGNPLLSWRVHVLPYLGYQELYAKFRLNEAWNSEHNLPLADLMPDVFRALDDALDSAETRLQIISAEGAPYYWRRSGGLLVGPSIRNFTDDISNSLLFVQTGANKAITWTQPEGINFDPNDPLASLGTLDSDVLYAAHADGSTIKLPASMDAATFKALVTISGGELLDSSTLARQFAEERGGVSTSRLALDNAFKAIAIAMHNYYDGARRFPTGTGPNLYEGHGTPNLSWRVQLLPYLGYQSLYNRFNQSEPWNSETNLALLAEMPDLFRSAGDPSDSTTTRIQALTSTKSGFTSQSANTPQFGLGLQNISDGTSNTVMFIEADADDAVPWTKPADRLFDVNDPFGALGDLSSGAIRAAFFDTSVWSIPTDIAPAEFLALVTRNTRDVIEAGSIANWDRLRSGGKANGSAFVNQLKQIVIAVLNFHDTKKRLPASSFDANGQPLLSWRVHILPYLEQNALYDQFRLNEPWDSPHNLSLLDKMPDFLRAPDDAWDSVTTRVQVFTGTNAPFPSQGTSSSAGRTISSITDGTSNTIAFIDAGADAAVPWTKPTDLPFWENNPLSPLGDLGAIFFSAMLDGSVQTRSGDISADLLKALITHRGGESMSNPPPISTVPNFYVRQSGGDTVTNEFGADSFDVVLDKAPTSNVVIQVGLSDNGAASLDTATVTFTPANWNQPQRVVFRPTDNQAVNSDKVVTVTFEVVDALSDASYGAVQSQSFAATIRDDDYRPSLIGDYNRDGSVNVADYIVWRMSVGSQVELYQGADGDGNTVIGTGDHSAWRANYGSSSAQQLGLEAFNTTALASDPIELAVVDSVAASSTELRPVVIVDPLPSARSAATKPVARDSAHNVAAHEEAFEPELLLSTLLRSAAEGRWQDLGWQVETGENAPHAEEVDVCFSQAADELLTRRIGSPLFRTRR